MYVYVRVHIIIHACTLIQSRMLPLCVMKPCSITSSSALRRECMVHALKQSIHTDALTHLIVRSIMCVLYTHLLKALQPLQPLLILLEHLLLLLNSLNIEHGAHRATLTVCVCVRVCVSVQISSVRTSPTFNRCILFEHWDTILQCVHPFHPRIAQLGTQFADESYGATPTSPNRMMVGGGAGGGGMVLKLTCPMGLPSGSVTCTSPMGGTLT